MLDRRLFCLLHFVEAQATVMAYVRKFGRSDLIITVTTNPKWPEILESLTPGQQPHDRPDLLVRVFRLKIQNLLKILKGGCFGCLEAPVLNFKSMVYRTNIIIFLWLSQDAKFCLCNYFTILLLQTVPKPKRSHASQLVFNITVTLLMVG